MSEHAKKSALKSIVVFFSLGGNTEKLAKKLAVKSGAELFRISLKNPPSKNVVLRSIWAGFMRISKQKPALEDAKLDLSKYDLIILGAPVWADSYAAPIDSFLAENKLEGKKLLLFTTLKSNGSANFFVALKKALPGNEVLGTLALSDTDHMDGNEIDAQIDALLKNAV